MKIIFLFFAVVFSQLDSSDLALNNDHDDSKIPKGDSLNETLDIDDDSRNVTNFQFQAPKKFDSSLFDNMFEEIDQAACIYKDKKKVDSCIKNLKSMSSRVVGNNVKTDQDFFTNLNSKIFQPLAININNEGKDSAYSYFFTRMANGQYDKSSLLENRPLMTNYNVFEESIKNSFDDIMSKSHDVDAFQQAISELIISLLKRCHIYWNSMRQIDQVPQAIEDTKTLIKTLVTDYYQKNDFLQEVIQVFLYQMKIHYRKFIQAHHMFDFLKKQLPSKIIDGMISRFQNECEKISYDRINYIKILVEYDALLDMHAALQISLFRHQYTEDQIRTVLQTQIETRFMEIWNAYRSHLQADKPVIFKKLTDFTAIVLLKMRYRIFIFQYVHNLAEVVNSPNVNNYSEHKTSVRVYHELKDTMMLIPQKCAEYMKLKPCFIFYTNEAIRYLSSKYQLKRSIGGIGVFGYLHDIFIELNSKPTNQDWENFTLIKEFFYQNLFSMLQNYKNIFLVKNEITIGQLESIIGKIINQQRVDIKLQNINQGLIDQFDQDIYDKFLQLKADYNIKSPFNRDPAIMTDIVNEILEFLKKFHEKFIKEMNNNFRNLIIQIANQTRKWKEDNLKSANEVIQIQELPLNVNNDYPQVYHEVIDNQKESNDAENLHEKINFHNEDKDEFTHHIEFEQLPLHNSYNNSIVDALDNSKENGLIGSPGSFGGD